MISSVQRSSFATMCGLGNPSSGSVLVQVSAHGDSIPATMNPDGSITWTNPQPRVAPGQSVVFYADDVVLGGAIAV